MAFGWTAPTSSFASVVRKPNRSAVTSPSATFRVEVHVVQTPAKNASGRSSTSTNHTVTALPSGPLSFSEKDVKGTRHRD